MLLGVECSFFVISSAVEKSFFRLRLFVLPELAPSMIPSLTRNRKESCKFYLQICKLNFTFVVLNFTRYERTKETVSVAAPLSVDRVDPDRGLPGFRNL